MATYIARELLLKNKVAAYATWCNYPTILQPGELAIVKLAVKDIHPITEKECETSSYLIKVGDGEHVFNDLPWLESSANIELYGTEDEQDYLLEEAESGYLELKTANGDDGIGSYAPSIKFVQQGLTEHLNIAKGYTENFAYKRDDLLQHIDKSTSKTVITYGEMDPDIHFNGDIYLKTVPERLPVSNNIIEYGVTSVEGQNWRYRKWQDGTVDLFTQIILSGVDIKADLTTIAGTEFTRYKTRTFRYECPFVFKTDVINSPMVFAQVAENLTDISDNEVVPHCKHIIDDSTSDIEFYYTSFDARAVNISNNAKITLSIYINGCIEEISSN